MNFAPSFAAGKDAQNTKKRPIKRRRLKTIDKHSGLIGCACSYTKGICVMV